MAVQLGHPQGAYLCGFCSFTSPDHKVLVKHLLDHSGFTRKHEHVLWCGLCKPSLTDANRIDSHQQAITNEVHLNGSEYHDNNDLSYGDASNFYPGYNGPYNPYAFPNAYYYPMNIAYRNPCYGNVNNGYYQTRNTFFYSDDFYDGTDIMTTHNTPRFVESAPENKNLLAMPHNSENIHDEDSFERSSSITLSDSEYKSSSDSNSVNNDSGIETLPVDPQIFPENSLNKSQESSICEKGTFSKSAANAELNVVQLNESGTTSTVEPQPEANKSSIPPASDKTLSRKLNDTKAKKISSKGITDLKRNAVKRYPIQTNVLTANGSKTVPKNFAESSNLEFLSEAGSKGVGSSIVDTNSGTETNSINLNANTLLISVPNKNEGCYSKLHTEKLSENYANASSTKELMPASLPAAAYIEKIDRNNVSDAKNCLIGVEVDTLQENAFMKECNSSQLHNCEREASSGNFLEKGLIPAQDMNVVPILDAKSSKVYTTILIEDALDTETGSIDKNGPLTKIDLNEIHSEHPTGKLETLSKIQNSVSTLSENTPVSTVKHSPKMKAFIDRENNVSDIQIQSTSVNRDQRTKKDKVLCNSKQETSFESDSRRGQVKSITRDALNRNSHRKSKDNCIGAITESSKKCQSDKTGVLSNVGNSLRNSYQSDFNYANKNYGSVLPNDQGRLTYSEVVKRGLPLKSSS